MGVYLCEFPDFPGGGKYGCGTVLLQPLDLSARRAMESNVLKCIILVIFFGLLAPHIWYVGAATLAASIYVVVTNLRYVKKLTPQLKIRRKLFRWSAVKELVSNGNLEFD